MIEGKERDLRNQEIISTFNSEEVQEIMGRKPTWIARWGITVLVIILLGIIVACWFIKYPQTVMASITLTSNNPPADLTAKYTGIIDTICVADGDVIQKGQLLALISSAAEYKDILWAEELLTRNTSSIEEFARLVDSVIELQLGDIQPYWLELKATCVNYVDYLNLNQIGRKKKLLSEQIGVANEYYLLMKIQRTNIEDNLRLEKISLERDSLLLSKRAIAKAEYEKTVQSYLAQKNALANFDASMTNTSLSQLQREQEVIELEIQKTSEVNAYERSIFQAKDALRSKLALWKEQYAITSPCNGQVSLQNVWSRGQHVSIGDLIVSINPNGGLRVMGRVKVPSIGFGKVEIGQSVNIKLNGFPYLEFGILKGVVSSISSVPEKTAEGIFYTVDVSLPDGLESTYHIVFPFVQEMDGLAEIITDDMRLLEQFIRPIRSLFVNK